MGSLVNRFVRGFSPSTFAEILGRLVRSALLGFCWIVLTNILAVFFLVLDEVLFGTESPPETVRQFPHVFLRASFVVGAVFVLILALKDAWAVLKREEAGGSDDPPYDPASRVKRRKP